MTNEPSSFCFILDSIVVSGELPLEIIPGHWFRKATHEEIDRIKKELTTHRMTHSPYEYGFVPTNNDRKTFQPLPPDEWNYYVISFNGSNDKLGDLEYAANLLRNDINLGYTFLYNIDNFPGSAGIVFHLPQITTFFVDHYMFVGPSNPIESSELLEITPNYNLITGLDKTRYPNVSKAVSDFHQTKMITNRSKLKVLSYFSILECLLTHPPRPIDTMDSLTHQISTKMSLLSKQFQRELQYNLHFPSLTDPEKVWRKLYGYRSLVAHGGNADFKQQFAALQSTDNIRGFLIESLKLLLLYALKEPDFLADLQKC